MSRELDDAAEELRRRQFLERLNDGYAALRADPRTWQAIEDERGSWDATLCDGLGASEDHTRWVD
jgi:hypothetical protein